MAVHGSGDVVYLKPWRTTLDWDRGINDFDSYAFELEVMPRSHFVRAERHTRLLLHLSVIIPVYRNAVYLNFEALVETHHLVDYHAGSLNNMPTLGQLSLDQYHVHVPKHVVS